MKTRILITHVDSKGKTTVREAEIPNGAQCTVSAGDNRFHLKWNEAGLEGEHVTIEDGDAKISQTMVGTSPVEFQTKGGTFRFRPAGPVVPRPGEPALFYLGGAIALHVIIFMLAGLLERDTPLAIVNDPKGMDAGRVERLIQKMKRAPAGGEDSPQGQVNRTRAQPKASGEKKLAAQPQEPEPSQPVSLKKPRNPSPRPLARSPVRPPTRSGTAESKPRGGGKEGRGGGGFGGLNISGRGGISRKGVIAALTAALAPLQSCYQAALYRDPSLEGIVTLKWVVSERGNVGGVSIIRSAITNAGLQQCVKDEIARIRFPRPKGGPVAITYPLVFSPRSF